MNKYCEICQNLLTLALAFIIFVSASFGGGYDNVKAEAHTFTDLKRTDGGYSEVISLVNQNIIKGYADGSFKPYQTISREHVAVMLTNALQLPEPKNVSKVLSTYNDVDESYTYAKQIAAVTEAKIFSGGSGKFQPREPITREQMATVLVRAFNLQGNSNPVNLIDINKIGASHRENVKILAQNEITLGKQNTQGDRYFDGRGDLRRVQFAIFLDKALTNGQPVNPPVNPPVITPGNPKIKITDEEVLIEGKSYEVADNLKGIFHPKNNDVLKNAKISFETTNGEITRITSLEIIGSAGKKLVFDAMDNWVHGTVSITGNVIEHITIKNLWIENGKLTINAPNSHVIVNNIDTTAIDVVDVANNSFVLEDSFVPRVNFSDKSGGRIVVTEDSVIRTLVIKKGSSVILEGAFGNIQSEDNAKITLQENAIIQGLDVEGNVSVMAPAGSTINKVSGNGKIIVAKGSTFDENKIRDAREAEADLVAAKQELDNLHKEIDEYRIGRSHSIVPGTQILNSDMVLLEMLLEALSHSYNDAHATADSIRAYIDNLNVEFEKYKKAIVQAFERGELPDLTVAVGDTVSFNVTLNEGDTLEVFPNRPDLDTLIVTPDPNDSSKTNIKGLKRDTEIIYVWITNSEGDIYKSGQFILNVFDENFIDPEDDEMGINSY